MESVVGDTMPARPCTALKSLKMRPSSVFWPHRAHRQHSGEEFRDTEMGRSFQKELHRQTHTHIAV